MSEKPQTGPNIKEFAKQIKEATNHIDFIGNDGKPRKRDFEEEARWFVSYQMACDMCETYRAKDWAHYVLEGMQPLTDEDVREWFQEEDEETGDPTGEPIWPDRDRLISWFSG